MANPTFTQANQSKNSSRRINSVIGIATLNAAVIYTLSYFGVYLLGQLATFTLAKYFFKLKAVLYVSKIQYLIDGKAWHKLNILTIFTAGPTLSLILFAIFLILFKSAESKPGLKKQLFFWGALHSLNLSIGTIISGAFTQAGMGYALKYGITHAPLIWAIAVLALFLMLIAGFYATVPFFLSCDSLTLIRLNNRRAMLWSMLIFPWLLGGLLINLVKSEVSGYDQILHVTLFFCLIPIYIRSQSFLTDDLVSKPRRTSIAWELVLVLLAVCLFLRLLLVNGIK